MKAQGEKRGHLTQTDEPEAQHSGGDAAVIAADSTVARRTIAQKAYRDRVASYDLHERWGRVDGVWQLVRYTSAVDASCPAPPGLRVSLAQQRRTAYGY